jgi:hypothetical protein
MIKYPPEMHTTFMEQFIFSCTENTDLITNFYSAAGIAISTINAFKFYENNNVFLHCLVTVCPEELPDACLVSTLNIHVFLRSYILTCKVFAVN